jgi:hypothetical protein
LLLASCIASSEVKKANIMPDYPEWLDNPQKESNGRIAAVGCSTKHFKGISAQKKLAVQRAIDEIAMQTNTKVSNVVLRQKSNISSSSNSTSLQEVNEENISTTIMQYYTKKDGDICVWVIKN